MKKVNFLKKLRSELELSKIKDIDEVVNYYDELIEDEKENGKTEDEIVKKLDIGRIVLELKQENILEMAKEKPSISNNLKAIIATLLVISSPLLIPLVFVLIVLIFVGIIFAFCLLLAFGILTFSGGVIIVGLIIAVIFGEITFTSFVLTLGISFISLGVGLILFKLSLKGIFYTSKACLNYISKRKGSKKHD